MKNIIALSVITVLSSVSTMAEQEPSYNFIEGGYVKFNLGDSSDISLDGVEVRGNIELNDNFYFDAGYISLSDEDKILGVKTTIDLSSLQLGIGYKINLMPGTSFFTHLNYFDSESKTKVGSSSSTTDDDGYELGVGLRTMVSANAELYGEISHFDSDGGASTHLTLGTRLMFDNNFGGYAEYIRSDFSSDSFGIGVSYRF